MNDTSPSTTAAEPAGDTSPSEWIAFERLLADLAAKFANVEAAMIESEIEQSMSRLIAFLGFDRSSFLELHDNSEQMDVICSVAVTPFAALPRGPHTSRAPWVLSELRAGRAVRKSALPDGLPADALEEREFVRLHGIRSQLLVPLHEGGHLVGMLTLVAFRDTRAWPDAVVARLSIVGHVFVQALARSRIDRELARALAQIRSLKERLEAENHYLRDVVKRPMNLARASRSALYQRVLDELAQVAPTPSTVLLLGETGTGKEVLAEAIHDASPRQARPMITINCAALPPALIEAELFGREKGAYTGALARQAGRFELAHGSTLFLDEIGEMPMELQTKLLRVLQDGRFERVGGTQTITVDIRLVAATNRDLAREVEAGRFRQDLYYRLNVFPISVPPLRERREDIPMLAWTFVKEFAASFGKPIERIADASMAALVAHAWPGNVRELRNVIERAMILSRGPALTVALSSGPPKAVPPVQQRPGGVAVVSLFDAEREHLRRALEGSGWRVRGAGGAAEQLDIKPTTLESRMKKLGLRRPHGPSNGS